MGVLGLGEGRGVVSDRIDTARAFGDLKGWTLYHPHGAEDDWAFDVGGVDNELWVPRADAQLHDHLEFVGRIAEALAPTYELLEIEHYFGTGDKGCRVTFMRVADHHWHDSSASVKTRDLSHAALLAGTAALRGAS